MKRLAEVLNKKEENHIFPLFWQHGEDEATLRTYMEKISASGIRAVCLEARPHPEFLKEKWWKDFDVILEEAKKREMKIWILDDAHFPTGYAAGAIRERYPQYRKRFLKLHQLDFVGPCKHGQAIISYAFDDVQDHLEGVYLARKQDFETIDPETISDITANVRNNQVVSFDLQEGEWKLLVLVSTFKGGEAQTEDYLNPIVPEATDVLLETVYEPHYAYYKDEFGKTILGFFSDEPRFGNMHGPMGSIGRYPMVLPWREDLAQLLSERIAKGTDCRRYLPLLFVNGGEQAHQIRYHYMDLVSDLYAEHFSGRIGAWCQAHGVSYIGHTIEDNNAHARLGYGAGHFFKAMKGQSMAGIDVVLHQLMPGMDRGRNKAMTSMGWDGEFFHYVLGKLGSSLGHLDPKKQGRVMCEVFGAYGWSEGNRLMKWITDYMLVRGINEFCPHGFDPKEYPDPDCPPHFFANGHNPQFADFRILMEYMNRLSHLLSGGVHRAMVAVLYHGEAEWSGDYMLMQKPCAELTRNQIDFDILPQQALVETALVKNNGIQVRLQVYRELFGALIVPYAEALPAGCIRKLCDLSRQNVPIFILDDLPVRSSEGVDVSAELKELGERAIVLTVGQLISRLRALGVYEVKAASYEPYLRYYHYEQPDGHILMVTNEAPSGVICTELEVPFTGTVYRYDAFENKLYEVPSETYRGNHLQIELSAYESAVYCWGKTGEQQKLDGQNATEQPEISAAQIVHAVQMAGREQAKEQRLEGPFKVSFAEAGNSDGFTGEMTLEQLVPIQQLAGREDFAGVIRYETIFRLDGMTGHTEIELDTVYEGARVSVNGRKAQVKICPPYVFDVTEAVQEGENKLVIEATTTLGRAQKDWLSQFLLLEPIGITQAVVIRQR
jgi:hypothetical protein